MDEKSVELAELSEAKASLIQQLQAALQRGDSESLARSVAEETVAELEKEKTMKELEMSDLIARHAQELSNKDNIIATVSLLRREKVLFL